MKKVVINMFIDDGAIAAASALLLHESSVA